jgi:hypothetical protein
MPKDKLTDYDSTASNNTDVGGISVAEGMLPSGVNNAIREQMSHLADFAAGTSGVDVLKLQDDTDTNSIKLQAPSSVTTTTTFTLPDGDGSAGAMLQTDGSGQLGWSTAYRTSNLIINGAMTVAQRGTSQASITSTGYTTLDRFRCVVQYATFTKSQSTDVPSGQGFASSLKMACTTSASPAASNILRVDQRIEGQNLQHLKKGTANAESLTLSFWVKSNKTGTYIVELFDEDNSRHICKSYTISSSGVWQKVELTYSGDTSGAFDNDNASSLGVYFWLGGGSDYTGGTLATSWASYTAANRAVGQVDFADSTSNEWYITGVQLEVGETATPFEHEDYGTTLRKCQRYYYKIGPSDAGGIGSGIHNTTTQATVFIPYQVEMREGPSAVETSSTASNFDVRNNNGIIQLTSTPSFQAATKHGAEVLCNHGGTSTQGEATILRFRTANDYIAWSAEL